MNYDVNTAIILLLGSFFLLIILKLPVIFAMEKSPSSFRDTRCSYASRNAVAP